MDFLRSGLPDLSLLDFYLWGTLKNKVYQYGRPSSIGELKRRISHEIASLEQSELENVVLDVLCRAELLKKVNDDVFDVLK